MLRAVRRRIGQGSAEAADAAAEPSDASERELECVTLEPLSIFVATRSHLFADIS
jgi:hypothetical protein